MGKELRTRWAGIKAVLCEASNAILNQASKGVLYEASDATALARQPQEEPIEIDPALREKIENDWLQPGRFMPDFIRRSRETGNNINPMLLVMSTRFSFKITRGEVPCFYPDEETFEPEEVYMRIMDILEEIDSSSLTGDAISEYLSSRGAGGYEGRPGLKMTMRNALLTLKDALDHTLTREQLENSDFKRYIPGTSDLLPPYYISMGAGHYVLRKDHDQRLIGTDHEKLAAPNAQIVGPNATPLLTPGTLENDS